MSIIKANKVQEIKHPYHDIVNDFLYERVVRNLTQSRYCDISENEEIFIKYLLYKFHESNQRKQIQLERMSSREINVSYNGYPIGRIKLNGRKTWMQILTSTYGQNRLEDTSLEKYIDSINLWIDYIRKLKLNN